MSMVHRDWMFEKRMDKVIEQIRKKTDMGAWTWVWVTP